MHEQKYCLPRYFIETDFNLETSGLAVSLVYEMCNYAMNWFLIN